MTEKKLTTKQRFEQKYVVDEVTGCWNWTAAKNKRGYGRFTMNDRTTEAHRASWEFHREPIPKGLHLLHKCDNPSCVNPDHLSLGTAQDNMTDKTQKGRQARGERHGNHKLTEDQVTEIYGLYDSGWYTQKEIATRFGIHHAVVSRIFHGKAW